MMSAAGASLTILSQLILGHASLDILSKLQVILGYPNLQNLYRDIPGYPDLPRVSEVSLFRVQMRLPAWAECPGQPCNPGTGSPRCAREGPLGRVTANARAARANPGPGDVAFRVNIDAPRP